MTEFALAHTEQNGHKVKLTCRPRNKKTKQKVNSSLFFFYCQRKRKRNIFQLVFGRSVDLLHSANSFMWTCSIFNELILVSIVLWCSCCCHWAIKCDCECETTREKINQNMQRLMCALTPYVELATHRKSTKAKLSATKSMINSSFGIESLMNDKLAGNHFVLQNRKIEILSTQKFFCFRKKVETEKNVCREWSEATTK